MQSFIHADIFFFITSIVTVVLAVFFAIALFYIIMILRDLRYLSDLARKGGDKLSQDIAELRGSVLDSGTKVKTIFDYFLSLFIQRTRKKAAKKETQE